MKKLIIILIFLSSAVYSQDTCKQYVIRNMDFSKVDTVKYLCDTLGDNKVYGKIPTQHNDLSSMRNFYIMQGKPANIQDTNEVIAELQQVQKSYQELYQQKVKALETSDTDLLRIQGIILYLNQKLESERKKK